MKYKIPESEEIAAQAERVLSFVAFKTITDGSVDGNEIRNAFNLPNVMLQKIGKKLIAEGKIVEVI